MIEYTCQQCGHLMQSPESLAAGQDKCPNCGDRQNVPPQPMSRSDRVGLICWFLGIALVAGCIGSFVHARTVVDQGRAEIARRNMDWILERLKIETRDEPYDHAELATRDQTHKLAAKMDDDAVLTQSFHWSILGWSCVGGVFVLLVFALWEWRQGPQRHGTDPR